jgi:tRNA pseudouridine synthase 10
MLRFLGVRDYELYQLSSKEIKDILMGSCSTTSTEAISTKATEESASPEETTVEAICTACVGTIQFAESFVDEIVARIHKEGYITKTFNMNVTMPTSTLIRNHAICIHWRNKLLSTPYDLVDIKEIFKLLISWPIEVKTGLTLDFGVN